MSGNLDAQWGRIGDVTGRYCFNAGLPESNHNAKREGSGPILDFHKKILPWIGPEMAHCWACNGPVSSLNVISATRTYIGPTSALVLVPCRTDIGGLDGLLAQHRSYANTYIGPEPVQTSCIHLWGRNKIQTKNWKNMYYRFKIQKIIAEQKMNKMLTSIGIQLQSIGIG